MTTTAAAQLKAAIAVQKHYPCRCHDWVYVDEEWKLVARPT